MEAAPAAAAVADGHLALAAALPPAGQAPRHALRLRGCAGGSRPVPWRGFPEGITGPRVAHGDSDLLSESRAPWLARLRSLLIR